MSTQNSFRDQVLRVVAVIGLIAVLLLGAWGIIQIAFNLPSFFGNITNFGGIFTREPAKETLTVSVPTAVLSERAFPLSWKHSGKSGEYSYSISYSCVEGVSVIAPLPNGTGEAVGCNTPFNYLNATSTSPMMVKLAGKEPESVTFTVAATKLSSGIITKSATSTTSVNPLSGTATSTKPTTTKKPTTGTTSTTTKKPTTTTTSSGSTYTPSGRTHNLYGYPDLQVYILSTPGSVQGGTRMNLQFVVENIGTNVTPTNWSFTVSLPYNPTYTYQSDGQPALYPGDKIVYNLGYDAWAGTQYGYGSSYGYGDPYYGYGYSTPYPAQTQSVSVSVDPYGYIAETNKYNNTASVSYTAY
jgi:hypothetical protein